MNNINFEDAEKLEPFFEEINLEDIQQDFNEPEDKGQTFDDFEQQQQQPDNAATRVNLSFIDAQTAINITDSVLPNIISYAIALIASKKVKPNNFSLTAQEKKTLEPIVKGCLEKANFSSENPFKALFITLTLIYGSKILQIDFSAQPETSEKVETRGRPKKIAKNE